MKRQISNYLDGFKKDPDIFITLIIVPIVITLNLLSVIDLKVVIPMLLAISAITSISILKNRQDDRKLLNEISKIKINDLSFNNFLKSNFNISEMIDLIMNSKETLISGLGHTIFFPILNDLIEHDANKDIRLKFLLMDPNGYSIKIAAFRAARTEEELRQELNKNIVKLENLGKITNGRIEYRLIDYLPPYNIVAINPNSLDGSMVIHLAAWRSSHAERPFFFLRKDCDERWFNYFIEQFNVMWDSSNK